MKSRNLIIISLPLINSLTKSLPRSQLDCHFLKYCIWKISRCWLKTACSLTFPPVLSFTLKLGYCTKLTDSSLSPFCQWLFIRSCKIWIHLPRSSVPHLEKWKHLRILSLKVNQLFSIQLHNLEHLTIKVLNLSCCWWWWCKINDDTIIQISKLFPQLNTLDIAWCSQITT